MGKQQATSSAIQLLGKLPAADSPPPSREPPRHRTEDRAPARFDVDVDQVELLINDEDIPF